MEWLTSSESLSKFLNPSFLFGHDRNNDEASYYSALDMGCGSSSVGLNLARSKQYSYVLNVDNDPEVICTMKRRAEDTDLRNFECDYLMIDLNDERACRAGLYCKVHEDRKFDLVIDKSTLDCLLCSDSAHRLLVETYGCLREGRGVYCLISFHSKDLIMDILQNNDALNWESIECFRIKREAETISGVKSDTSIPALQSLEPRCNVQIQEVCEISKSHSPPLKALGAWKDGLFEPCRAYATEVNVFICRKAHTEFDMTTKSIYAVGMRLKSHIHVCLDTWFKETNPMLSVKRESNIRQSFQSALSNKGYKKLHLKEVYKLLFEEEEKEHYSFEYFMDDWSEFICIHNDKDKVASHDHNETADVEIALKFLEAMQ